MDELTYFIININIVPLLCIDDLETVVQVIVIILKEFGINIPRLSISPNNPKLGRITNAILTQKYINNLDRLKTGRNSRILLKELSMNSSIEKLIKSLIRSMDPVLWQPLITRTNDNTSGKIS